MEKKEKDGQTDQERSHRPRNKEPREHISKMTVSQGSVWGKGSKGPAPGREEQSKLKQNIVTYAQQNPPHVCYL